MQTRLKALPPDHPLVAYHRRRFESISDVQKKMRKCKLTFDELLALFGNDCNSWQSIAQKAGITSERVRKIYWKYFHDLVGGSGSINRGGRRRLKVCKAIKRHLRLDSEPLPEKIAKAVKGAAAAGLPACGVPAGNKYSARLVRINGKLCTVHLTRSECYRARGAVSSFSTVHISNLTAEFAIILQEVLGEERIFVVPMSKLACTYGNKSGHVQLSVPVERERGSQGLRQRLNLWRYENALDLLIA